MGEDLEIKKDGEEPTDADLNEAMVEFTSTSEYIASACAAIGATLEVDTGIMTKADDVRKKRIIRKSLKILDNCITELYDELFDDDEDD